MLIMVDYLDGPRRAQDAVEHELSKRKSNMIEADFVRRCTALAVAVALKPVPRTRWQKFLDVFR